MHIRPEDALLCVHDPLKDEPPHPASTPVVQTSLFSFDSLGDLAEAYADPRSNRVYSRGQNPTVEVLEEKLAALERGEACKAFASGMAAVSAVFLGLLEAGDHIVFLNDTYGPTLQLARQLERLGIQHTVLRELSRDALEASLAPRTRLIWVESPGTMLFRVVDLAMVAEVARERGITTAIDNTWATPLLQKPLEHGFDVVMHTATKYLAGHSDVVAGAVVTDHHRMDQIFYRSFLLNGGILAPWDAWLTLRGIRTLPTRLREHERSALALAETLAGHPVVAEVHHPALTAEPEIVARQMSGFSGVFSFALRDGSWAAVQRVVDALEHFRIGVSWGGVESLVISPQRPGNDDALRQRGLPLGLIRLSIGLEGTEVLRDDLLQALATLG